MTKMKSWTIFILLTLTLLTLLIAPMTVWYNLKYYSVYYARYIPHKEEENPELVFVLENLYFINKPLGKNLEYEEFSHKIYVKSNSNFGHSYKSSLGREQTEKNSYGARLFIYNIGAGFWDKKGKFQYFIAFDNKYDNLNMSEQKLISEEALNEFLDPIIAIQPQPKLNLQWLFNWVYRDRFNQD